ncbi:MAG: non-ribosomal peptide synthetase, partial [Akkermansiaceae bacterium]|nr:non-ribosomal peptide synthetase [Akkermansiaceae bacterium]
MLGQHAGIRTLPLVPVPRTEALPLSYAQQRLWFLAQLEGSSAHYNMPLVLRLQGSLHPKALIRSLETIVARHESLRTRFVAIEGVAYQEILEPDVFRVSEESLLPGDDLRALCNAEAWKAFDLSEAPLIRARLLREADDSHVLLVTMHHSVSDGWSMQVFSRELLELYRAYSRGAENPLAPLAIQYADFAHWQRQWLVGAELERQESYWREQLSGLNAQLSLPADRPRPAVKTYHGAHVPVQGSRALLEQVRSLSERAGVTVFMTLLSAFSVLLSRYSGEEDIAVGSPIANRNRPEIEPLIGFFVNTLVLRTDVSGDPRFVELLGRVKEMALGAYSHQDLPFERLLEIGRHFILLRRREEGI